MAGSERPVLKNIQNPSSQSSLHLKVYESSQSSVSEERKITSEPYQCNGCHQRESKKEESKQKWSRTSYSKEDDKKHQVITLQARVSVVDEDGIEERRRALPTFTTGSTTPLQMESNFIQDTDCGFSNVRDKVDDLQLFEKETTIVELEMKMQKEEKLEEDVQELKAEVTQMRIELMTSARKERKFSLALVLLWVLFGILVMCLK